MEGAEREWHQPELSPWLKSPQPERARSHDGRN
jgi:hypothetical protein